MRKFLRKLNPSRYLMLRSTHDRVLVATELAGRIIAAKAYSNGISHERNAVKIFEVHGTPMDDAPYLDYVPRTGREGTLMRTLPGSETP